MAVINRSQYFNSIYVVQFLRAEDDKTGLDLYRDVLEPEATAVGVHTRFFDVATREEFLGAIHAIVDECRSKERGPILHLETHGDDTGIGTYQPHHWVSWAELKPLLTQLNVISKMNLVVTMAACYGLNLVRTILPTDRAPAWGMLGPDAQVMPSDVRRGFCAFYSALLRDLDFNTALNALRANDQSWPETWRFQSAELFFAFIYGHYLATEGSPARLAERENELVEEVRRKRGPSGIDLAAIRSLVRVRLHDEAGDFERLKRRFFMLDLFSDTAHRFNIDPQTARTIYDRAMSASNSGDWLGPSDHAV